MQRAVAPSGRQEVGLLGLFPPLLATDVAPFFRPLSPYPIRVTLGVRVVSWIVG